MNKHREYLIEKVAEYLAKEVDGYCLPASYFYDEANVIIGIIKSDTIDRVIEVVEDGLPSDINRKLLIKAIKKVRL